MMLDIRYYKFLSNEGYSFSYLISKINRFERFMAIEKVFEKNLTLVPKCKFRQFLDFLTYGKFFSKKLSIAIKRSNLASLNKR